MSQNEDFPEEIADSEIEMEIETKESGQGMHLSKETYKMYTLKAYII